jgi:hypothetical protein
MKVRRVDWPFTDKPDPLVPTVMCMALFSVWWRQ